MIFVPGFAVVWLTESTGTLHDAVGFGTAGAAADADVTPTRQTTADAPAIATARNRRDEIMVNRLLVKKQWRHIRRETGTYCEHTQKPSCPANDFTEVFGAPNRRPQMTSTWYGCWAVTQR